MTFGIKEILIILTHTKFCWLLPQIFLYYLRPRSKVKYVNAVAFTYVMMMLSSDIFPLKVFLYGIGFGRLICYWSLNGMNHIYIHVLNSRSVRYDQVSSCMSQNLVSFPCVKLVLHRNILLATKYQCANNYLELLSYSIAPPWQPPRTPWQHDGDIYSHNYSMGGNHHRPYATVLSAFG